MTTRSQRARSATVDTDRTSGSDVGDATGFVDSRRTDEQRRMARQPPAVITEIGRRPSAPQAGLTAAAAEEATDPSQHVVPVRGRSEQDRTVEQAAWSSEVGHRDVVGIECPPAAGESERRIERGVMGQVATQQRVAHGGVVLPTGGELLVDGHGITMTTALAGRLQADRTASHVRRTEPEASPSVVTCASVCWVPSS